jgi:hypothetical protein
LVVASTIGGKTRINLFDGENELCSGSEARIELQKFSSIRAQVHNHFNQERHLVTRADYKQRHSVALAEWRTVIA